MMKYNFNIHIKINTGMNRFGINDLEEFKSILLLLKDNKNIRLEGIYTHCFCTCNKKLTNKQIAKFKKFVDMAHEYGFCPIVHVGGSGIVGCKIDFVDCIRCGIALYGYNCKHTKPVLKIESRIIKLTSVKKGEFVGYDCFYRATKNVKVALIPLGYADGVCRQLENKLKVVCNNKQVRCIGKICMDMFFVDCTRCDAKVGDMVDVFFDANIWSKATGISVYQVLTQLNQARTDIKIV